MTPEEFDACFDRARESVFRLETLQRYTVTGEQARIEAFRRGAPRPDRSVRTSPWLRRIAVTTAAGMHWQRVRLVDLPLSEYIRYQQQGYIESAAAGEEVLVAVRTRHPELAGLCEDFWLFDENESPFAIAMNYDEAGRPLEHDFVTDQSRIERYRQMKAMALAAAIPLNEFIAARTHAQSA